MTTATSHQGAATAGASVMGGTRPTAARIASSGAGWPVIIRNCSAAWCRSIATPGATAYPRSGATSVNALAVP